MWDEWAPGDEDDVSVRQRVEMSFESVRLEKAVPTSPVVRGLGIAGAMGGSVGGRNVSAGSVSLVGSPIVGTPGAEMASWTSPASVLRGGFRWT